MDKTQAITVYNPGNSDAFFKFSLGKDINLNSILHGIYLGIRVKRDSL